MKIEVGTRWFKEGEPTEIPDGAYVTGVKFEAQHDPFTGELILGREITWIIEVPNE